MLNKIKGLVKEEQGQGLTEYGLLLAVVVVLVVAALVLFKTNLQALLDGVATKLSEAIPK